MSASATRGSWLNSPERCDRGGAFCSTAWSGCFEIPGPRGVTEDWCMIDGFVKLCIAKEIWRRQRSVFEIALVEEAA